MTLPDPSALRVSPSRLVIASLLALSLAACATTEPAGVAIVKPQAQPPARKPAAGKPVVVSANVDTALQLLVAGKPDEARPILMAALKANPANDMARKLISQIDTDPKVLLGAKSYPYKAKAGDTASALAERFLGDPLMFYALARYNDLDPPSQPLDGRTVMIPGEPKPAPKPAPIIVAKPAAPAAVATPRDPVRASHLRSQGLLQLNQGAVGKAVGLLQQAQALDPDSAPIKRDLQRALNLQKTVSGK
jgi:hypothetical protein